jgi:hypothetical protein
MTPPDPAIPLAQPPSRDLPVAAALCARVGLRTPPAHPRAPSDAERTRAPQRFAHDPTPSRALAAGPLR